MRYLVLFILGATVRLIEYRLWKHYGQVIPDTSLNSNHAVNGLYSTKDSYDCLYSDRGLYFSHSQSALRLPPNDRVQNIYRISTPYTVILWVNNFNTEGRYFSRWMNQQHIHLLSNGENTIGITFKSQTGEYAYFSPVSSYAGI